jgi:aryl-alcohol dehydrogenase-like predicted oxidoreductase
MLGGNVFGWTANEAASFAILDAFVDSGFNAIDTADVYSRWSPAGAGASETVLGAWFKASRKRDRVILATKVGMDLGEGRSGLSARWIVQAVDESLRRLQTDYIDLYQAHRDDPETPQGETLEAFAALVKAGKVRVLGASNFTAERLASANALADAQGAPRYETLQPLYNLYDRAGFEADLADLCRRESISVIPFYGLASGFLTGKYRSETDFAKSPRGAGMKKYLNSRGEAILAALDAVSQRLRATPAQIALAWLMTKIAAPIASATSVEQLRELMAAARLTLDAEALAVLETASAPVAA